MNLGCNTDQRAIFVPGNTDSYQENKIYLLAARSD